MKFFAVLLSIMERCYTKDSSQNACLRNGKEKFVSLATELTIKPAELQYHIELEIA